MDKKSTLYQLMGMPFHLLLLSYMLITLYTNLGSVCV